jgi:hypothetical protein
MWDWVNTVTGAVLLVLRLAYMQMKVDPTEKMLINIKYSSDNEHWWTS